MTRADELLEDQDVVVVATGVVSPYGHGVETLWAGLVSGATAIRPLTWDVDLPGSWIAGHVPGRSQTTSAADPVITFAVDATTEALGGLIGRDLVDATWGVVFGSCNGALATAERSLEGLAPDVVPTGRKLDALAWLSPQAVAEAVADRVGATGPVHSVNTACASGAHAIMHGADLLRRGSCDLLLAGGSDALSRVALIGFTRLGALASEPARPYAADRAGMSLGEGAAALVLCLRSTARARGLPVVASLRGVGTSADGHHITDPHPEGLGAGRAIRAALESADAKAEQIGYVNGHGTGTTKNDIAEDAAISLGLGTDVDPVPLSSTKSMTGHLLGAAGALEAVVVIEAMRRGVRPPSGGVTVPDPRLRARVVREPEPAEIEVGMSNSFAFGGANACLVLGQPSASGRRDLLDDVVVTGYATLTVDDEDTASLSRRYHLGRRAHSAGARILPDLGDAVPRRAQQRTDRAGLLVAASALPALARSGLAAAMDVGLYVGTGFGPTEKLEQFLREVLTSPASGGSPRTFPNTVYNAPAGHASQICGLRGPTSTLTGNLAAGLSALVAAHETIARNRARAVVVTGLEVSSPSAARLSRRHAGRDRHGGLHEISVSIVLERRASALARGANILGTIRSHGGGYGGGPDSAASADGLSRAVETALAGIRTPVRLWPGSPGSEREAGAQRSVIAGLVADGRTRSVERLHERCGAYGGATALASLAVAFERASASETDGLHLFTSGSGSGAHMAVLLDLAPPGPLDVSNPPEHQERS